MNLLNYATVETIRKGFNKLAFWFLIAFLLGASSGLFISYEINSWLTHKAIQLEGMIVNGKVYDIKIRL